MYAILRGGGLQDDIAIGKPYFRTRELRGLASGHKQSCSSFNMSHDVDADDRDLEGIVNCPCRLYDCPEPRVMRAAIAEVKSKSRSAVRLGAVER